MFLKGGTHLTHRTPKNVRLQRYDHDHVGNRAERVKILECYGRSKVMLRGSRRRLYSARPRCHRRPPRRHHDAAAASYYLPLTSRTRKLSLLLVTYDLEKADSAALQCAY